MISPEEWMHECLVLAKKGEGFVEPNPLVGCVIVRDGEIISKGFHHAFGREHAEVDAISKLPPDTDPGECTLVVNLEPCSHHGKTPPCADLIIQKGFGKVIVGTEDPNPKVAGEGIQRLRDAGIEVQVGVIEEECRVINKRFFHFHQKGRTFITLKWAQTADGYIGRRALQGHLTKRISNDESRSFVHKLRANHRSIMIGAQTANQDNPRLTTRYWTGRDPVKIIISMNNTVERDLQLFREGYTLVYNTLKESEQAYCRYVKVPHHNFIVQVFEDMYQRGIQSVLVEGGSQLLQSLMDHDLWDEIYVIHGKQEWGKGVKGPTIPFAAHSVLPMGDQNIYYYSKE